MRKIKDCFADDERRMIRAMEMKDRQFECAMEMKHRQPAAKVSDLVHVVPIFPPSPPEVIYHVEVMTE